MTVKGYYLNINTSRQKRNNGKTYIIKHFKKIKLFLLSIKYDFLIID